MGLALAWGLWRGKQHSRTAALWSLGLTLLTVTIAYGSYALSHDAEGGPWVIVGGTALLAALGLSGPSLFERRVLAAALSAAIWGAIIFAGGLVYLLAACVLFAACI